MNKELYLNETTKVGVVVQDENEFKIVESNENEDTYRILSLQNEIERENKYVNKLKELLEQSKDNIKWRNIFSVIDLLVMSPFSISIFSVMNSTIAKLIGLLILFGGTSIISQMCLKRSFGTYKENKFYIKELPKGIEKSEDKIKSLEEELKNLKEKSNYNVNKLSNEDMINFVVVNYPERINDEKLVSDIQIQAKIKKITFNNNGTTK